MTPVAKIIANTSEKWHFFLIIFIMNNIIYCFNHDKSKKNIFCEMFWFKKFKYNSLI